MTAGPSIDPARFLNEQLAQASPDLMRDLLTTFVNALLSAQADAVCGAAYGARSSGRVNSRNGYRHRDLDTRTGTWALLGVALVLALGGLTLWLHDELFIKLKPTIVNSIFAGILVAGLLSGRLFLKFLLDSALQMAA